MNQKKIKAIRKNLRQQGVDLNDREYHEKNGTRYLRAGCGRYVYKMMKGN